MHLFPGHLSFLVVIGGMAASFSVSILSGDFSLLSELLEQALGCWNNGDFQQVTEVLERICRLDASPKTLIELGLAYALNYNFKAAEKNFEAGIRAAPAKKEALMQVGLHWRRLRRYSEAENCFSRVLQQSQPAIEAYAQLAEIYRRQRQLDRALEMIDRALSLKSDHGETLLTRATIMREKKEFAEAEKLFRSILDNGSHSFLHSATWSQLAIMQDQQGRYDEAMASFLQGKTLLRAHAARAGFKLQAAQASRKQVCEKISAQTLQRWSDFGKTQLQPARKIALLCGHARSGTTLLEYVLDSHQQIISADETFVFDNKMYFLLSRSRSPVPPLLPALDGLSPRTIRQVRANYYCGMESFFGGSIGDRLLVDKNPILTPDLPAFFRFFPESKFLIAVRDPRDVCLSCFMQTASINADSSSWLSLEGTVQNYVSIMNVWLALKPHLPNAMEVRYEDMVENFEPTSRRVLAFLGLEWDERLLRFDENARSKTVLSPTFAEVTKPVYKNSVGRWRNYEKYFAPHMEKLNPFIRAFGYE